MEHHAISGLKGVDKNSGGTKDSMWQGFSEGVGLAWLLAVICLQQAEKGRGSKNREGFQSHEKIVLVRACTLHLRDAQRISAGNTTQMDFA